jgi:hypothetical protein
MTGYPMTYFVEAIARSVREPVPVADAAEAACLAGMPLTPGSVAARPAERRSWVVDARSPRDARAAAARLLDGPGPGEETRTWNA